MSNDDDNIDEWLNNLLSDDSDANAGSTGINDNKPEPAINAPEPELETVNETVEAQVINDSVTEVVTGVDFEFESEILLHSMEADLARIESEFKTERVQYEAIEAEERELRNKLQELARRKREFADRNWDVRHRITKLRDTDIPGQRKRVEIDRQNAESKRRAAEELSTFNERTKDAKWRDRAFKHQLEGAAFLASARRAVCADQMGLGKTLQSIMWVEMLGLKSVLVVAPGDTMRNYANEMRQWSTGYITLIIGKESRDRQAFAIESAIDHLDDGGKVCLIVNYETWNTNKWIVEALSDVGFEGVIIDEAHRIKEIAKRPYRGVRDIIQASNKCKSCGKVAPHDESGIRYCKQCQSYDTTKSVQYFLSMTGSPILNTPSDIYSQLHLAYPEIFQTLSDFVYQFCNKDYFSGKLVWKPGGQSRLAQRINGFYIQRTRESAGIVLPPQEVIIHEIEIDPDEYALQTEILETLRQNACVQMADGKAATIPGLLALITRQRQATVWPGGIWMDVEQFNEDGQPIWDPDTGEIMTRRIHVGKDYQQSAKIDRAIEIYEELKDNGHRVVFFSQFREVLVELKRRLGNEAVEFHGGVPDKMRDKVRHNFDKSYGEEPKWNAVLAHYMVGGVGVNFTAATAIIALDEEWNDPKNEQAYDRIHRIGQDKETQVHILRHVGPGKSIDTWLVNLNELKRKVIEGFKVSVDELKKAFE